MASARSTAELVELVFNDAPRALEELLREISIQAERGLEELLREVSTGRLGNPCDPEPCMQTRGLCEAIQSLPTEIREMILKEFIAVKQREKRELGWCKVHDDLKERHFHKFEREIDLMMRLEDIECNQDEKFFEKYYSF